MNSIYDILIQIFLLALGFVMLTKGADWFVDGAAALAARLHIPQLVIGLTVVALGTSAPEAAVSISAALKGTADITIGNVVGSNIMNILVILGLTAAITALPVASSAVRIDIPFTILTIGLMILLGRDGIINVWDGVLLWILFICYLVYLFVTTGRKKSTADESSREDTNDTKSFSDKSVFMLFIAIAIGIFILVWGSDIAVNAATSIALDLGISERLVGLTIVALGTSLPELVTSVTAAVKNDADIAVGNIIGSCLFNVLFVLGTSALITPISFSAALMPDALVSLGAAVLLFLLCFRAKKLNRLSGVILLAGYVMYFIFGLL